MDHTGSHDGLIYIGDGTAIVGVPARDLTAEEADQHGRNRLIVSGLYRSPVQEKVYTPKARKSAIKKETEVKES